MKHPDESAFEFGLDSKAKKKSDVIQVELSAGRLDHSLFQALKERGYVLSRERVKKVLKQGGVSIAGSKLLKSATAVEAGQIAEVNRNFLTAHQDEINLEPWDTPLDVLYEDADLLVINKARGMVCHPGAGQTEETLVQALLFHTQGQLALMGQTPRPGIVHRLDKDTCGLMLAAKSDRAYYALTEALKRHEIRRSYQAICAGHFDEKEGFVEGRIARDPKNRLKMSVQPDGKFAKTHFIVQQSTAKWSWLKLQLETGRTHQIRVHMAAISHPLLGDQLYGDLVFYLECQDWIWNRGSISSPKN